MEEHFSAAAGLAAPKTAMVARIVKTENFILNLELRLIEGSLMRISDDELECDITVWGRVDDAIRLKVESSCCS